MRLQWARTLEGLASGLALGATTLYGLLVAQVLTIGPSWRPEVIGPLVVAGGASAVVYAAALIRPVRFGPRWVGYVGMWPPAFFINNYLIVGPLLLLAAPGLWAGPRRRAG